MERRLRRAEVMTIEVLHEREMSNRAIARQLGVHENAVRYRLSQLGCTPTLGRHDFPEQNDACTGHPLIPSICCPPLHYSWKHSRQHR